MALGFWARSVGEQVKALTESEIFRCYNEHINIYAEVIICAAGENF